MSTTHKVVAGDTFETISRKSYGVETNASLIEQANPGVLEPLTEGILIIIPSLPGAPQNLTQQALADNIDETAILIDGTRFRFWNNVRINRSVDSISTVSFGAPFQADAPGFKENFRPFKFKPIEITVGGAPLFKGTMVPIIPVVRSLERIISVDCYSLPGVLNDCTPPASMAAKLEFNGQGLKDISAAMVAPFGISVEFQADQGAIFNRVASKSTKKIMSFLIELAKQRNLIISDTTRGALLFWKSVDTGNPVARLRQGASPVLSITPQFNPQEYYSHITGIEPSSVGRGGSQYTVKNSHLNETTRPLTFTVGDTKNASVKTAVEAKMGRMFGNMASYSIEVNTWRDPLNNLWAPNTTITLFAPDAMIYTEYEFIVRSVEYNVDRASRTAVLNLVIPGSFSGEIPELLPWDG